jgi:5-oxoprolinase (ATP-hydrolysing)/N-methylhydantoinase A
METRAPVLVIEKSLIADSGGPGRRRGGLGVRTRLRKLHDDGRPTLFSVYPEGVNVAPAGLDGGHPGGGARGVVLDRAGRVVHDCGTGELVTLDSTDRVVEVCLSGGAGYGDAQERNADRLDDDVADGYVSQKAAAGIYGARERAPTAAE